MGNSHVLLQSDIIPVAHIVRNPVEVLISAYLYHQQDPPPEEWLYDAKPDALEILPMDLQEQYATVPYYKVVDSLKLADDVGPPFLFTFACSNSAGSPAAATRSWHSV